MDNANQHIGVITTRPGADTTMIGDLDRDTNPALHQQVTTTPHGTDRDSQDEAPEDSAEVHQAQGMVMVQLNGNLAEALTRMRTYAYVHHRRLCEVAADVVARRLQFDPGRS